MSWRECKLGDLITLKRGHDLPNAKRVEGDIPVVSSSGITGYHNEAKAAPPGVVTGRYGTLGEVYFLEKEYWPLNTALYVIDFKDTDPRFSAYILKDTLKLYKSDKAAVPGVDRNVLHSLKVRAPNRDMQERIVDILFKYDNLIENNNRRVELLEESARQLYKEWFVRFRFPGHEHVTIIDGVPEGWCLGTYGDAFRFLGGFAFKSKAYTDGGKYGIVTIKNVHDSRFVPECPSRVEQLPDKMKEHCKLSTGDILLSLTGNVGRACIVFGNDYLLNQRVAKITTKGNATPEFAYWTFTDRGNQKKIENLAYGVAQLNLSPVKLAAMEFVMPTRTLIEQFSVTTSPIFKQIVQLNLTNQELAKARDLLLPKLTKGEIAV
ncbi:restriction endonuclease subunit S [Marinobacter sp.]|uniref:restriction endonuclease subunit S n=1 Tax=Marinobacter sp. TaxID=50741 RepID=UPI003A900E5A